MSRASRLSYPKLNITLLLCLLSFVSFLDQSVAKCTVKSKTEEDILSRTEELQKYGTLTLDDASLNSDGKAKYKYYIAICTEVEYSAGVSAPNTGVLQEFSNEKKIKKVGDITKADVKAGNNWMMLTYHGGDNYSLSCNQQERQAVITLICDPNNLVGNTMVIEEHKESDDCYYLFEISTKVACTTSMSTTSISIGSILCIILVCFIVLYILIGFLYQRCVAGAKGIEQFPNISFWREFGNLVADGADFVFRTKPPQQPKQYKGLGDDQLQMEDDDEDKDDHLLPM